jgi:hypothetical protein
LDRSWDLLGLDLGWINIVWVWTGFGFTFSLLPVGWNWVWAKTRPVAGLSGMAFLKKIQNRYSNSKKGKRQFSRKKSYFKTELTNFIKVIMEVHINHVPTILSYYQDNLCPRGEVAKTGTPGEYIISSLYKYKLDY